MVIGILGAIQIDLLVWVVVLEGGVVATGLVVFLGHATWTGLAKPRLAAHLARGQAGLQCVLQEGGTGPPGGTGSGLAQLAGLPRRLQIDVLTGVASSLAGAQRERLCTLAAELGILVLAEARCRSRLWWRRLQGARLCTLLGGGEEILPALLGDPRPQVRVAAAEWVIEHHDAEMVDVLLRMLSLDDASTRFAVQDSLIRLGRALTPQLAMHLLGSDAGESLGPALEVAVALGDPDLLPSALELCKAEPGHIRSLAAALAGAIGGDAAIGTLVVLLGDEAPEVRAAAARALGRAGHWPAAAALAPLLGDPSWDVRQQAAVALRSLGSPGMIFLRRALSGSDPFAADAASRMLDLPGSVVRTLQ